MLLTTTPGDLLTDEGQYAYNIRNNATPWNENYYDRTIQQLEQLRDANTNSAFFLISYTYQQLGSGQDYFKRMVVQMNRDWPAIRREVMLEWAETATNCPFSQEDLDIIKEHLKQPIRTIFFGRFKQYIFNIYEDLDLSYPPIIGVDVAGAMYHDSSAITVIDSHTTRVCATLNCNYMPSDDLAEVIYELVTKYMNNAIINIERNGGFGISVVQRLCKTSVKKNLYWEVKDKVIEEKFNGVRMQKNTQRIKVYGLDSTREVRARLIEILYERVAYHKDKFVAPILHQEMQAMEVKKNGKVEHSDLTHDDQIFSYLMALYVWYEGKNLREVFGIEKSGIKTEEDVDDIVELSDVDEVTDITREIEMVNQDDTAQRAKLNQQLMQMQKNKGILFSEYVTKQRKKEHEILQEMLRDPVVKEAYAHKYGIDPESVSVDTDYDNSNGGGLPNSIFMDFDKFDDELSQTSIYNYLNDKQAQMNRQNDASDSYQ